MSQFDKIYSKYRQSNFYRLFQVFPHAAYFIYSLIRSDDDDTLGKDDHAPNKNTIKFKVNQIEIVSF